MNLTTKKQIEIKFKQPKRLFKKKKEKPLTLEFESNDIGMLAFTILRVNEESIPFGTSIILLKDGKEIKTI